MRAFGPASSGHPLTLDINDSHRHLASTMDSLVSSPTSSMPSPAMIKSPVSVLSNHFYATAHTAIPTPVPRAFQKPQPIDLTLLVESLASSTPCSPDLIHVAEGELDDSHRIFFLCESHLASPWHDISLDAGHTNQMRMLCLTPAGTRLQFECVLSEPLNPLRLRRSNQRFRSRFPAPPKWNLGIFPQTLSAPIAGSSDEVPIVPSSLHSSSLVQHDSRPIQVVEIGGGCVRQVGEAYTVKPLGAVGAIDCEKEVLTWTVISIATDDWLADKLTNLASLERLQPGTLAGIQSWLRSGGGGHQGWHTQPLLPVPATGNRDPSGSPISIASLSPMSSETILTQRTPCLMSSPKTCFYNATDLCRHHVFQTSFLLTFM